MKKMVDFQTKFKVGDRVIVKSFPIADIIGATGRIMKVNPFGTKWTRNMVRFDISLDPSRCECFWFADEDLEVLDD